MVDTAIISGLLENLAVVPVVRNEFWWFWNSNKEDIEKLSIILSSLHDSLDDVDRKIIELWDDKQIEDWLRNLKDVAYEVRDIMDEWTFEELCLQIKRLNASSSIQIQVTNCITHPFSVRLKLGHKIKEVLKKLDQISSELTSLLETPQFSKPTSLPNNLDLGEYTRESKSTSWCQTISKVFGRTKHKEKIGHKIENDLQNLDQNFSESKDLLLPVIRGEKIYGRDKEKEEIINILVHSTQKLSVLSILGIGGLGKTTLAQIVFNDQKVTKCFDVKLWVCVSEEFDLNSVIRAMIGVTNENSLEKLQNEIQEKLRGKKYLIVLDDVWNENIDKWNKLRSILDCGLNGSFILTTTRKRKVAKIMKTQYQPPFELSSLSDEDCWQLFEERAFMYGIPKTINYIVIGKEITQKCKGVPLIAKTLGGQLGFKWDEKDWCRIRDTETWNIYENQESIFPILKLSYNDLPYHLRRCFAFCAIFPKDTEIEKERLIQLWMAHDLISIDQDIENCGNKIWNELCWRSFFQDEKKETSVYINEVQITCQMSGIMHDFAQSVMKDECYRIDANPSSENFRQEILRHVMVTAAEYTISNGSLKKMGGLHSLILHFHNYLPYSKETFSVLKELSSLRVLEVSRRILKSQDLLYVGRLKHLRYLNLSFCKVKTLNNSICDLLNLQTLNLNHSSKLRSLPRNTKNLINLRHLHLKGCDRLKYMPRGMGRLRQLKTLSLFVIGKELDGQLGELIELDIGGYMEIKNLESVSDASMARRGGISMSKKSSINHLVLHWNNDSRRIHDDNETKRKSRDEKICEALKVSTTSLKILSMCGYKGVNIPKWMGKSSASLTVLHLSDLDNVEHIFSVNNDMNETVVTLFPLLEELKVSKMKNLREILSHAITVTIITEAFPNLWKIEISCCPKLEALPPHLKSLKDLTVEDKCTDGLLSSISDLRGLTRLSLTNVNEIRVITLFPLLEKLEIRGMENLKELVSPLIPITTTTITTTVAFPNLHKIRSTENLREFEAFPNLRKIRSMQNLRELEFSPINLDKIVINTCPKLGVLPLHLKSLKDVTVKGQCTDALLHSISNLTALTRLTLMFMEERSVLFGGSASAFQSLRHLEIRYCYKLSCLFDEKYLASDFLKKLNSLTITGCRNLTISLDQLTNLTDSHSLQSLEISNCPKFVPSKVKEIALMSSLRERLGKNFRGDIRQGRRCRNCNPTIPLEKEDIPLENREGIV